MHSIIQSFEGKVIREARLGFDTIEIDFTDGTRALITADTDNTWKATLGYELV